MGQNLYSVVDRAGGSPARRSYDFTNKDGTKWKKLGIIDLGSNSARLVIVDLFQDGYFMVEDEIKESVRLGQDMDRDGFLKPQRVAETNKTLKMFKRLCDASVACRRASSPSPRRRSAAPKISAPSSTRSRRPAASACDVLSEEEEATLVYRGVINSMDVPKGIILEIGGGSTKIVYYNRRTVLQLCDARLRRRDAHRPLRRRRRLRPRSRRRKIEEFFTEQFKKIDWLSEVEPGRADDRRGRHLPQPLQDQPPRAASIP